MAANKTWVKASDVKRFTGWNDDKMHRARLNGLVKYKKEPKPGGGYHWFYLLESINERFFLQPKAA